MSYVPPVPTRRRGSGWWLYGEPISDRSANMLIEQARRHARWRPAGPHPCPCGECGRTVSNWDQECYPQPWWDTPGLPPRRLKERCAHHHGLCAYRDDDPYRCPTCHTIPERCNCQPSRRSFLAHNATPKNR
jgi:hypothetical protein